ncbi:uncharacterized protein LOC112129361 [Pongo abelii]|uniref:uncharacterized protein LOC112129361 n=1 Tax=Pongo abelii TaxID=9601 RepID=UPI0023E76160|nr:uncharacterized protein LOC112129361 [Pongo abelii]
MAWPDAGAPGLPGVTQGSGAGRPLRRGGPGWSGRGGGRSEPVSSGRLRRRGEGGVCCPATRSPRPGRQKELVRYQKNPDAKLGVVLPLPASAPHPPGAAADRAGRASYPLFWPGGELVPPAAARPRPQTPGPLLICICPELRGPGPLEEALASGLKSKGRATCREGGCHLCKGADPSARSEEAAVGRRTARWEAPRIVGGELAANLACPLFPAPPSCLALVPAWEDPHLRLQCSFPLEALPSARVPASFRGPQSIAWGAHGTHLLGLGCRQAEVEVSVEAVRVGARPELCHLPPPAPGRADIAHSGSWCHPGEDLHGELLFAKEKQSCIRSASRQGGLFLAPHPPRKLQVPGTQALSHTGQSRTILTAPAQQTLALWREAGSRSSAFWASVARAGPATAHFCLQPRHPPGPPDAPDLHGG